MVTYHHLCTVWLFILLGACITFIIRKMVSLSSHQLNYLSNQTGYTNSITKC